MTALVPGARVTWRRITIPTLGHGEIIGRCGCRPDCKLVHVRRDDGSTTSINADFIVEES